MMGFVEGRASHFRSSERTAQPAVGKKRAESSDAFAVPRNRHIGHELPIAHIGHVARATTT